MFKLAGLGLVNKAIPPGVSASMVRGPISAWTGHCRQRSENASTNKPCFKYFWQQDSGYYGDMLGKTGRLVSDICEDFLLPYIGKVLIKLVPKLVI